MTQHAGFPFVPYSSIPPMITHPNWVFCIIKSLPSLVRGNCPMDMSAKMAPEAIRMSTVRQTEDPLTYDQEGDLLIRAEISRSVPYQQFLIR
ncbi:hypothetical protein M0802_015291 [Mischocyttarus mexicanus]|nr:hypothetical protein M0802_015291 [Mischocyttarus mexicanus]